MSIFGTPIANFATSDLQELLTDTAVENIRLEFKREVAGKDETLKKISSFANTFGGYIVIGAEANSADGRIVGLPGVGVQAGYKQTIIQWCFAGMAPPLIVEVSDPIPAPAGDGKVCYIINVPESDLAPHFLNGRRGLYVRTDEFSTRFEARFANENELRHLLNRRQLVSERRTSLIARARERFHAFSQQTEDQPRGVQRMPARINLAIVPRYPAQPVADHDMLLKLIHQTRLTWRGIGFPADPNRTITQHESVIALRAAHRFSLIEANTWGLLFYATDIAGKREQYAGIHVNQFLGTILVFIKHAAQIIAALGITGSLHVEVMFEGVRGIPWIYFPSGFAETGPESELDDNITFAIDTSAESLSQRDNLAMKILQLMLFSMNWPAIADSPEKLADLIDAGYKFNLWK